VVARAVSIAAGLTSHEDLSAPAATPVAPTSTATPVAVTTREGVRGEGPPDAAAGRKRLAWFAAGGAVAVAAAGGVVLFLGNRDASSFNTTCADSSRSGCADLQTRGKREQVAGVVGLVAGGALGATAAWLFLSEPARPSEERRVACAPALDRWGAACALRF
jgi:hypothetical protein